MKNNNGKSFLSCIIGILIVILMAFLVYEIVYVDILGIMPNNNNKKAEANIQNQSSIEYIPKEESESMSLNGLNLSGTETNSNNSTNSNLPSYRYYYNQLDEYGKTIYEGLEENKENMKSGTYTIDFGTEFNDLLNSSGGEETLNIAFQSAWNAYTYDNMDIFYIDVEKLTLTTTTTTIGSYSSHRVELSNGENSTYLKENFLSSSKLSGKINLLEAMRDEIKRQLEGYSDYQKIREVHNWLVNNIEYDINLESEEPYSICGALTDGEAVCEGYARSFKYIMDELQIPCVLVSGIGTNSNGQTESHAWNYVMLNDNWYAIDVTWDDPVILGDGYVPEDTRYRHFLKGSNTFFTSHEEDGNITSNSIEFTFPELSREDYVG